MSRSRLVGTDGDGSDGWSVVWDSTSVPDGSVTVSATAVDTVGQSGVDPFHVVRLAGDALDRCRRRVQQQLHGHRGLKNDPLYRARRTLHTGVDLLTDRQHDRLDALFNVDAYAEVQITWDIYQQMITAYREPDRKTGRALMTS